MAVKLDVLINYIFNNTKLKQNIAEINKMMLQGVVSPRGAGGAIYGNLKAMFEQEKKIMEHYTDLFKNNLATINKLNKGGFFKEYISPEANKSGRRINLTKEEAEHLAKIQTNQQMLAEKDAIEMESQAWEENRKFDEQKRIQEKRNQEEEARKREGERKWNIKMNKLHEQALKENKERDEALRKKQWMLMLGKWGRFGVWGLVAQQAIKYISKAVGYAYSTSMQGLDWQRTIRGGASGGSWFGQGLAGYQRAGIGANQYQGFKRGIQGYLGSVKLGMGNAAPLMYLGLSALGKPDELERQLEQSLRRLPKDVSLALAGQMGLDYNMWEAIYSGRIDRQKSAYSEEAIQKWANLADSLNDLITSFKTFWFNNLAPVADFSSRFINNVVGKESGWLQTLNLASAWANPAYALGSTAGKMLRMKIDEIVVTLKDSNGNVIEKTTTQAMTDGFMEVPQ